MIDNKNKIIVLGGFAFLLIVFIFMQNDAARNRVVSVPQTVISTITGTDADMEVESTQLAEGEMEIMPEDVLEINLTDVNGGTSTGTATIVRKDGMLLHTVTANLPDPGEGNVYEGWLVQESPLSFFSTGVMEKELEGVYSLTFSADQEYPTYNKVVITLETVVDQTPETHVLDGSFK